MQPQNQAESTTARMSPRARLLAVLAGQRPDRLPFIGRLALWHRGRVHNGTLPREMAGLPLTEIHRRVGFGRQRMQPAYQTRLRGVEVEVHFEGERIHREQDPVVDRFPDVDFYAPADRPGITQTTFRTTKGKLTVEHTMLEHMLATGTRNYMSKHPIQTPDDYKVAAYILERMELAPRFDRVLELDADFGDDGYVMPMLERIPFQQLLIDYFSTEEFFFALHDEATAIEGLLARLDEKVTEVCRMMAGLDLPYVEIGDNLDGMMTNPRLFRQHCLPVYQRYTDLVHGQGKRIGSHTDGNLKPLLGLLAESGLDVCESFSPAPLTPCTVADALAAWPVRPVIWGGIPSPLLEESTSQADFEAAITGLLETLGDRLMVLNVVDMVLPINSIERIARIAELVEAHPL
jgi:hypothetical protein